MFSSTISNFNPTKNYEYICAIFFVLLNLSKSGLIKLTQVNWGEEIVISKNNDIMLEDINYEIESAIKLHQELSNTYNEQLLNNATITRTSIKDLYEDNENKLSLHNDESEDEVEEEFEIEQIINDNDGESEE